MKKMRSVFTKGGKNKSSRKIHPIPKREKVNKENKLDEPPIFPCPWQVLLIRSSPHGYTIDMEIVETWKLHHVHVSLISNHFCDHLSNCFAHWHASTLLLKVLWPWREGDYQTSIELLLLFFFYIKCTWKQLPFKLMGIFNSFSL